MIDMGNGAPAAHMRVDESQPALDKPRPNPSPAMRRHGHPQQTTRLRPARLT